MDKSEMAEYEESLKNYRDLFSVIDTAKKDGRTEKEIEVVIKSDEAGLLPEMISTITGLPIEEINKILNKHNC